MRVIAGQLRGRRLVELPQGDLAVRPTSDRARESVFAMIGARVAGARFLDLYAGTGALGIEAVSRGASDVLFVDANQASERIIRKNLESLGIADRGTVVRADVRMFLKKGSGRAGRFNLVYIDPPYASKLGVATLPLLANGGWLESDSWVIVETGEELPADGVVGFQQERARRYGQARISVWRLTQ